MKKFITIMFATLIAVMAFFSVSIAEAGNATIFNNNPKDFATTLVSNYTQHPACTNCWDTSVEMGAGEVLSVAVYYHNTGPVPAGDTRIRMAPQVNPAVNNKIFAGGVWASNATLAMSYANVHIG